MTSAWFPALDTLPLGGLKPSVLCLDDTEPAVTLSAGDEEAEEDSSLDLGDAFGDDDMAAFGEGQVLDLRCCEAEEPVLGCPSTSVAGRMESESGVVTPRCNGSAGVCTERWLSRAVPVEDRLSLS